MLEILENDNIDPIFKSCNGCDDNQEDIKVLRISLQGKGYSIPLCKKCREDLILILEESLINKDFPVQCVDGSCPIANAEEYDERGIPYPSSCAECSYSKEV